jgi:hypothetical protein
MDRFFERFPTPEPFLRRARTSEEVCETEIIPQLEQLPTEETWRFPDSAVALIRQLVDEFRTGRFQP